MTDGVGGGSGRADGPDGPLRLAVAQAAAVAGDLPANATRAAALVREAGDRGARVVVLPEAFLTGYAPAAFADPPDLARLRAGELDVLRDAARATGAVVVVGSALARPERGTRTLAVVVVDEQGAVSAPYDKQHLFDAERVHLTAGDPADGPGLLVVDDWVLGLSVCYDHCFGEHALAAAEAGAWAYVSAAAYFRGGRHRSDLYLRARALDHGLYAAMAGLTGDCAGVAFGGGSAVHDPEGRTVAALDEGEGVAVADLDPDLVRTTRATHPMLRDRPGGADSAHRG